MLPRDESQSFRIVCPRLFGSEERPHSDCGFSHRLKSRTASLRATATTARFLARAPPSAANINPYARRALLGPNGPRMYCAALTSSRRRYASPRLEMRSCGSLPLAAQLLLKRPDPRYQLSK